MGFWSAIRDVFPETCHQRDWVHKISNVLDSMPKSVHSRAKVAIKEITGAENKKEAVKAIEAFASEFGAKWPKAVAKIKDEKEALLAYYDYPAEHWRHLRTTNPIDTFFSFGPELVTPDEVGEVGELAVATVLNGEVRRRNTVSNMTFSPWELIAFHSEVMTLLPGDIISTGTPGAVVIRDGDVLECRITGFEPLINPVTGE